jgi:ClpP class serine protease
MLRGSKKPEEVDPAEAKMIQEMVMETYAKFKSVVKNGRETAAARNGDKGTRLAPNWEEFADGRILTGKAARDAGFVDQLGNFQVAVEKTREIAGISGNARLVRYQEPFSLARVFGMGMKSRAENANTVKLDLGLNLPKIEAGRMYFLSPTFAH